MAKARYTDPHTQIRNDVLENLGRAKLTGTDLRFLMILLRETFGRKRQAGKARGKWMDWTHTPWLEAGFPKSLISQIKTRLLTLRVIRRAHSQIGFNWHFNQWKCEWSSLPVAKPEFSRNETKVELELNPSLATTKQDDSQRPTSQGSSAPKERKEKKESIAETFEKFWKVWLSTQGLPQRAKNKSQARQTYTLLVNFKNISPQAILTELSKAQSGEFEGARASARRQGIEDVGKFLPNPSTWLERIADDLTVPIEDKSDELTKTKRLRELEIQHGAYLRALNEDTELNQKLYREGRQTEEEFEAKVNELYAWKTKKDQWFKEKRNEIKSS